MSAASIALTIGGMLVLALADFSLKQQSGKISPSLGVLIYAVTTIAIPLGWTLWDRAHGGVYATTEGIGWSVAAGIFFSLVAAFLISLFAAGVNLSIGTPVLRMGGIVLAAMLGIVVFREGLNWQYVIGFALAAGGIFLVATR